MIVFLAALGVIAFEWVHRTKAALVGAGLVVVVRVVGLFGDADLLGGFFPGYLAELRHTAFTGNADAILGERTRAAAAEPVEKSMRRPVTLDEDTGAIHAAERFLHCDFGALPVVRDERFVGMLGRAEFCRAVLRRWGGEATAPRARS